MAGGVVHTRVHVAIYTRNTFIVLDVIVCSRVWSWVWSWAHGQCQMVHTMYRLCTHHVQTVYRPCTDRVQTVYRPCTHHVQTVYTPCTHHVVHTVEGGLIHRSLLLLVLCCVVPRESSHTDTIIERQADTIRYLQQHNASLAKKILQLQQDDNNRF